MKTTPFAEKMEELYRGENNPRWRRDLQYFKPSPAGRRVCQLSPEATQVLIDHICGRHSKVATFVLIEPEGDIRRGAVRTFQDWHLCVKIALDEGVYIYNARTKRCSRPVWSHDLADRTFTNMVFESVRLLPNKKVYDTQLPKVTSRLFATENR